jgi:cation diffusion facilitator family transporter
VSGNRDRELTPEGREKLRRARKLERITIAYLVSAVGILALVLGSSQAMKTAWFKDLLSLIPPIAFLASERYNSRAPTERFPYGFHRTVSVGHLCAALVLFAMGGYLFVESVAKLVAAEHPTIGAITLFGQTFWLGWLMIPALLWSGPPAVFLGRAKMPLARDLHNKVLYADADMNKADWLTAGAAMVGVVGIGFGLWWTDAAAAALISLDITKDGLKNLRHAVNDLMDQMPTTVAHDDVDPLRARVAAKLNEFAWVEDAEVRLREEGQVYFGEAFVVPSDASDLTEKIEEALGELRDLDWRVHDVAIMPVRELPKRERE